MDACEPFLVVSSVTNFLQTKKKWYKNCKKIFDQKVTSSRPGEKNLITHNHRN